MNFQEAFIDELHKVARLMPFKEQMALRRKLRDQGVPGLPFSKERSRLILREYYKNMTDEEKLEFMKTQRLISRLGAAHILGGFASYGSQNANAALKGSKLEVSKATKGRPGSFISRNPHLGAFVPGASSISGWRAFSKGSLAGDEIDRLKRKVKG